MRPVQSTVAACAPGAPGCRPSNTGTQLGATKLKRRASKTSNPQTGPGGGLNHSVFVAGELVAMKEMFYAGGCKNEYEDPGGGRPLHLRRQRCVKGNQSGANDGCQRRAFDAARSTLWRGGSRLRRAGSLQLLGALIVGAQPRRQIG